MAFAGYISIWLVFRPASNVCPLFMWALRVILISYVTSFAVSGAICSIYYSPCFLTFAFFRGAVRAVLVSCVICPAVNDFPSLWALRAITWFGLLFPLLLTSALFPCGLCRQFCFRCYFIYCCGRYFVWALRQWLCRL